MDAMLSPTEPKAQSNHSVIITKGRQLMKDLGYGKGYQYDHDLEKGFSGQHYFPSEMERVAFYQPVERGFEREMKKRIDYFSNLRGRKEITSQS